MQLKPITAIIVLSLVCASLLVAGCTTSTTSSNSTPGLDITAKQLPSNYQAAQVPTQSAGNKYVMFNLTVKNVNEKDGNIDAYAFKLRDTGGNVYGRTWFLGGLGGPTKFDSMSHTQSGDKVSGVMAFEVPQTAKLSNLTYTDSNNKITINLSTIADTSTTLSVQSTPTASVQPTSTPSGSPSSNPSLISQPTSSPTSSPIASSTPIPVPTTTKKSVTIYAEPVGVCSYCEAAIAQYKADGWDVTVIREGDPGFVPQASYPGIVVTG